MTDSITASAMPRLGLGTWQLHGEEAVGIVQRALELGYRHIDTAQGYDNEREVGLGIERSRVPRDQVFITTKVWPDALVEDVRVVEASLERLGVSAVDLLLLHWPSLTYDVSLCLSALVRAQERGYCRHIGVSNFPTRWVARALGEARLFCHQVEYHPYLAQGAVLDQARRHGMLVTAYSPLAQGEVLRDPLIVDLARAYERTPAQVVLRWFLDQPEVAVIPRTSRPEHLEENLGARSFTLTPEHRRAIHGLARGHRLIDPDFAPPWDDTVAPQHG